MPNRRRGQKVERESHMSEHPPQKEEEENHAVLGRSSFTLQFTSNETIHIQM